MKQPAAKIHSELIVDKIKAIDGHSFISPHLLLGISLAVVIIGFISIIAFELWNGYTEQATLLWIISSFLFIVAMSLICKFTNKLKSLCSTELELNERIDHLQKTVTEQSIELRLMKQVAENANHVKSEFLANISHELKTPMHTILGFTNVGLEKFDIASKEKLRQYFLRIQQNGNRLLTLLNNLLDLARIEAGKTSLIIGDHDITHIVGEVVMEMEPMFKSKQLIVDSPSPSCSTSARCDPIRFAQVIRNLLSNAIKFSPDGKHIYIRYDKGQITAGRRATDNRKVPAVVFSIEDEGIGIPDNELECIFDKFVQSSKTKTGAGGTGLGLAISKEIIIAHQGKIYAHNNAYGGATFTVLIPTESVN